MPLYAHLPAHVAHRASRAARQRAGANMLAEGNEQPVDCHPILPRQHLFQFDHRFFGRGRDHKSPAGGHAVDVDIDADPWLAAADAQRQMGALDVIAVETL